MCGRIAAAVAAARATRGGQRRAPVSACTGAGGLELNERIIEPRGEPARASTGAPCMRFPTSCSRWPRRRASSCSTSCCSIMSAALCALRRAARGPGTTRQLAARLIGEGRLASFAGLWERIGREKADALALNLDRKALILETFARLELPPPRTASPR